MQTIKAILLSFTLAASTTQAQSCTLHKTDSNNTKTAVKTAPSIEQTFAMIKPEAVAKGDAGQIISLIEKNGFNIVRMEKRTFTKKQAEDFYTEHKGRPFYNDLVDYISSGPVIALMLEKENAITDWRTLLGATDPVQANMGTIRKMFAENKSQNAAHGSDSPEAAKRELAFFFKNEN
ncbi:MAG: nucleoside-diphosphate kinase [Candidatus Dependentiae bacterium]